MKDTIQNLKRLLAIYRVNDSPLIRVGRADSDGGYVLPEKLVDAVEVLYNYGVGAEITFEEDFLTRYPHKLVRAFDHTIEKYPETTKPIHYYKEGLAAAKTVDCDSFESHVRRFGDDTKKILLKIDVEGHEYAYFNSADSSFFASNVYGILMEVHWFDQDYAGFFAMLEKITENFVCTHLHGNNWGNLIDLDGYILTSVFEVCFVNKNFFQVTPQPEVVFPLATLDIPCNENIPDFPFNLHLSQEQNNARYNTFPLNYIQATHNLHQECARRDQEIARLDQECQNRDRKIAQLNRQINELDNNISQLTFEISELKQASAAFCNKVFRTTKKLMRAVKRLLGSLLKQPRQSIKAVLHKTKSRLRGIAIRGLKKIAQIGVIRRAAKALLLRHPALKARLKHKIANARTAAGGEGQESLLLETAQLAQIQSKYGNSIANTYAVLYPKQDNSVK